MNAARSSIRMAGPADDAALRSLFRETSIPGNFEVTLEREPAYFQSMIDASNHAVVVGLRNSQIITCGSRMVRETWWEGRELRSAYLGDLRCHPSMQRRAGWLLRDGYRALAECHAQSPGDVTWTAIFEENKTAREVLTGRSAGLPAYVDRGRLYCPILLVPRWAQAPRRFGVTWHQGQTGDWAEVAAFLNAQLCHRPLAPVHRAMDFAEGVRWPCLEAADFVLARRENRLIGVVAVWDVRRIKQVRITTVHGQLARWRRSINAMARLSGWPRLPDDGTILPMAFVSFLAVENEDADLTEAMLLAARALAARRGLGFLCACAHENHPFAKALQRLHSITSHGRLYEVALGGKCSDWTTVAPHIEPALL